MKKRLLISFLVLVALVLLYLGGVIGWAQWHDYQPPERMEVEIGGEAFGPIVPDTLTLFNWNIGFGGLGEESDFFYDGGKSTYMPEAVVEKNMAGILATLEAAAPEVEVFFLQEVDRGSTRSHRLDEYALLSDKLPGFAHAFAANYRVDFIPIPLTRPLGKVWSGIATWSRYQPLEATRYAYAGNYDWPTSLFFLDRCFLLLRYPLPSGRELVLINLHNSAYDDGRLKARQMAQLKEVLLAEAKAGHYLIVGGDWNQMPPGYAGVPGFERGIKDLDERFFVSAGYPAPGWQWAYDPAHPTNRSLAAPFDPDTTARFLIDFFLLSPNVEWLSIETQEMSFQYSDHQPQQLRVRLQ
jgi:endonuclease/exonuclease/phosphatase family metal-dependent hydrolase